MTLSPSTDEPQFNVSPGFSPLTFSHFHAKGALGFLARIKWPKSRLRDTACLILPYH